MARHPVTTKLDTPGDGLDRSSPFWTAVDTTAPGGPDANLSLSDHTRTMSNPAQRPYRRLTLSVTDKKIAGVCGGIAE